jgi:hypothetical protein
MLIHDISIPVDQFLKAETAQKMLYRFLDEKKISKEDLAKTMGVTVNDIRKICSNTASIEVILKISLPLIKLYCKTKF